MADGDNDQGQSGPRFGLDPSVARELGGAFSDLAAAFLTGTPTIENVMGVLGSLPGALGGFGRTLGNLTGYLEGQVELYQTLTRSGVNFGGRLDQVGLAAISARLNLEQLANIVKENSEVIAGFGMTADSGMQEFLRRSATFMDTEYATQLRRLGMTFEDINDALVDYERMLAISGYTNRMTDQERNRAAAEFAMELDVLSKLTGKQAEQIAEEMRERQREGDYRAFLMGLSPDQVEAVMAAQVQAEAAGVGDLFKDMMVRGVPSTEETRLQAAMMGESFDMMAQMRQQIMSGDTAGFERNAAGLAGVALNEMSSEGFRSVAMLGGLTSAGSAAAGALGDVSEANFRYISMLRDFERNMGRRATAAEAAAMAEEARAAAEAEQRAQMTDAAEGDTRVILQGLLGVQDQLLATAEEVQVQATSRLYQGLAAQVQPFVDQINSFNPQEYADQVASGIEGWLDRITSASDAADARDIIDQAFGSDDENARRAALRAEELLTSLESGSLSVPERMEAQEELSTLLSSIDDFTIQGGQVTIIGPDNVSIPGAGRSTGSIGMTGSILEDFGRESLALLHGREAVLTEQQLSTLASNLVNFGESQAFGGIIQELRQLEGLVLSMGNISNIQSVAPILQGMLNNIGPQMQNMAAQMAPQMQNMAAQMLPVMEQMAGQLQGPMREMAEQLRGPMENMASTMQRQLGVSTRSLRAVQGAGNLFRGLNV